MKFFRSRVFPCANESIFEQRLRVIGMGGTLISFLVLCLVGCAGQTYAPDEAPEMVVVRDLVGFYRTGPIQARGPDLSLKVNERLKLLRKEMGYSLVMLEDNRTGYVANEFLAPAPPRPPEPPSTSSPGATGGGSSAARSSGGRYRGPQVNDSPLPEPTPPPELDLNIGPEDVMPMPPDPVTETGEAPAFRY